MQYMFLGNGLGDLYGAIEAVRNVPSKMLIFDVFMDISQMTVYYLLGQPYFALIQFTGLLSNAFMSSVAPRMKALEKPNSERLKDLLVAYGELSSTAAPFC